MAAELRWEGQQAGLKGLTELFAHSAGSSRSWRPRSQKTGAQRERQGILGAESGQPSKAAPEEARPLHILLLLPLP